MSSQRGSPAGIYSGMGAIAAGYSQRSRKKDYSLDQVFHIKQGTRQVEEPVSARAARSDALIESRFRKATAPKPDRFLSRPKTALRVQPRWLANAKKVLQFFVYVEEKVENQTVTRHFEIRFFLEDGTVSIVEPEVDNSGTPQGVFLRRAPVAGIGPREFRLGSAVCIYGRNYMVADCDAFTRRWYEENGVALGKPVARPRCTYKPYFGPVADGRPKRTDFRRRKNELTAYLEGAIGKPNAGKTPGYQERFMKLDRKVLRFYCAWDGAEAGLYGEKRVFILYYFLSDETAQVCEVLERNCGRDPSSVLLQRDRLPKNSRKATTDTGRFGPPGGVDYYTDKDFKVGTCINVYGRNMRICACDDFTREYYEREHGFTQPTMLPVDEGLIKPVMRAPAPTGFGSPEDSLSSFLHLRPRVPAQDFDKFINYSNVQFRWLARLATGEGKHSTLTPEDADRRFVISLFPQDDTVQIAERAAKNSGFTGGLFLKRTRVLNPDTNLYFFIDDFKVGGSVRVNGFSFALLDEDRYTTEFRARVAEMEREQAAKREEDRRAEQVRQARQEAAEGASADDAEDEVVINFLKQLRMLLKNKFGEVHQWISVLDTDRSGTIDIEEFKAFLQMYNMVADDVVIKRIWDVFDTNGDGDITVTEFSMAVDNCEKAWSAIKYGRRSERKASSQTNGATKVKADPNVTTMLVNKFSLDEETATKLSAKYISKGTFSMDDLTKALTSTRARRAEMKTPLR